MSKQNSENEERDPDADLKEGYIEEDIDKYFLEAQAQDEEEEQSLEAPGYMKWVKKTIPMLLVFILLGNILAFWPKIYNLDVIQFLVKSKELSQNGQIQEYMQTVVVINASEGKGTGFNIRPEGYIITNQHIVKNDKTVVVSFPDIGNYTGKVIARDEDRDIAFIQLQEPDLKLPVLETYDQKADSTNVGDPIFVIGNPLHFNHIANEGTYEGLYPLHDWDIPLMIIDAPIYRGNSGSPIINDEGKATGVVFATIKIDHQGNHKKVGLAIPMEYVHEMISEYE